LVQPTAAPIISAHAITVKSLLVMINSSLLIVSSSFRRCLLHTSPCLNTLDANCREKA
jgi:hypothetical protein